MTSQSRLNLPFGLKDAGCTFLNFMNRLIEGLNFVAMYIDDILIHSRSFEEHMEHLRIVFKRLEQAGLSRKIGKNHMHKTHSEFPRSYSFSRMSEENAGESKSHHRISSSKMRK